MGSGYEDFGAKLLSDPSATQADGGEDTTRLLGGGGNLSRTGRWFWATGFEGGTDTADVTLGAGAVVKGKAVAAWEGNYCCEIASAAGVGSTEQISKNFIAAQSPGKWGVECMFCCASGANTDYAFRFGNVRYSNPGPARYYIPSVRIRVSTTNADVKLQYLNSANAWIDIATLPGFSPSPSTWHYVKMVYDFSVDQYVRVIVDGTSYDLSGISPRDQGSAGENRQELVLFVTSQSAGAGIMRVDNLILSASEP